MKQYYSIPRVPDQLMGMNKENKPLSWYINNYRLMWRWMARTGSKHESNYPLSAKDISFDEWHLDGHNYECWWGKKKEQLKSFCSRCFLKWEERFCEDDGSPFVKWCEAETKKDRKKYAKIIAELPLKVWVVKEIEKE